LIFDRLAYEPFTSDPSGVDFTNILCEAFAPIFLRQKVTKPKSNQKKAAQSTLVQKNCKYNVDEIDPWSRYSSQEIFLILEILRFQFFNDSFLYETLCLFLYKGSCHCGNFETNNFRIKTNNCFIVFVSLKDTFSCYHLKVFKLYV